MKTVERHRYSGKKIFQTRTLTFEPYAMTEIESVMALIRDNLSSELLKGRKSLLYPGDIWVNKLYGHCYHSTQALHFLMDDVDSVLFPMSADDYRGEKHWWLSDGDFIYDVTSEQYYFAGQTPPHVSGKKTSYYGWKQRPQQISLNLMVKVLGDRLVGDTVQDLTDDENSSTI